MQRRLERLSVACWVSQSTRLLEFENDYQNVLNQDFRRRVRFIELSTRQSSEKREVYFRQTNRFLAQKCVRITLLRLQGLSHVPHRSCAARCARGADGVRHARGARATTRSGAGRQERGPGGSGRRAEGAGGGAAAEEQIDIRHAHTHAHT